MDSERDYMNENERKLRVFFVFSNNLRIRTLNVKKMIKVKYKQMWFVSRLCH